MNIFDIFNSLKGDWKITRTISNTGVMNGAATFAPVSANELLYSEEGTFIPNAGAQAFKVYQNYRYAYAKNQIDVFKIENNDQTALLHTLKFLTTESIQRKAVAYHLCGDDIYHAIYLFFDNEFQLKYNVTGPKKNYAITTQFYPLVSNILKGKYG